MASAPYTAPRAVRAWLTFVFLMIVAMTAVGGITRLTGSGLSMVVWEPLVGAIPPLNEAQWHEVFDQYKATPQYAQVNHWMQLSDFQRIFFWEYIHRLLGRTIGSVVLLPWLWFLVRRQLSRKLAWQTLGLLILGGSQGLLGWYMVQSGLVDVPRVSHLRLAAHLLLAFAVAQAVLWVRLSLQPTPPGARRASAPTLVGLGALGLLLFVQSGWGAFMAGTRAGWFASSFPDVNGAWLPSQLMSGERGLLQAMVFEPGPIHATHRLLAWALLPAAGAVVALLWREAQPHLRQAAVVLGGLVLLQVLLGSLTVILTVPTSIAVAHQVTGLLLVSAVTLGLHRGLRAS